MLFQKTILLFFETASISAEYTFNKRGVHRLSGLKVSTRFPFGLFVKGKEGLLEAEALILPSIANLPS